MPEDVMSTGDLSTPTETKWKIRLAIFSILAIIGGAVYHTPGFVREWRTLTPPAPPPPTPPASKPEAQAMAIPDMPTEVPVAAEEKAVVPIETVTTPEQLHVELVVIVHQRELEPSKKIALVEKPVEKPKVLLLKKAGDSLSDFWDLFRVPLKAAWQGTIAKLHK